MRHAHYHVADRRRRIVHAVRDSRPLLVERGPRLERVERRLRGRLASYRLSAAALCVAIVAGAWALAHLVLALAERIT